MAKKKKEPGFMINAVVYGIFNTENSELIKVSLDSDEIDMDLALQYVENKYTKCEFALNLFI